MEPIYVVAAIIRSHGNVLLAKRAKHKHQGGLWEFPGGKIEPGESPKQALVRELKEELGINVITADPIFQTSHQYPEYAVHLDIWEVTDFTGEAVGAEGQDITWVNPKNLLQYDFPAANRAIITAARLPSYYLMIPPNLEAVDMVRHIQIAIAEGVTLIGLTAPRGFDASYRDIAIDAIGVCAGKAQLMIKGAFEWLGDFPMVGWHVTAKQLRQLATKGRPLGSQKLLAASCHNLEDLMLAKQFDVDFAVLSPIESSLDHSDELALGWDNAAQLITAFDRPVYMAGGLGSTAIPKARNIHAQGVADILSVW